VEVAEGALVADRVRVPARLRRLADLGVRVAIDDYGTGGSSLTDLADLGPDALKLDAALVSGGEGGGLAAPVVLSAAVHAAHALGVATIAEGVETAEQLASLTALGCGFAQGRHLAPPLDAAEVPGWLTDRRR
jgi:EAL domain-containing protein (putative c-di-GMP-specific phosphodiesterase class I)